MMEAVKLSYRILFNLEFALEGYTDDINQHLKIMPDKTTGDHFSRYRLLSRKSKSASVSLIEVEPDGAEQGRPKVLPKEDELFRFEVKVTDQNFFARTHLTSYDFKNQVLLLTNEVNHIAGTEILLSRPIANYDSGNEYRKGYLARSGSNYFMALQESNAGNPHPVTDATYWSAISSGSFTSQADLQSRTSAVDLDTIMVIQIKHSNSLPAAYRLLDSSSKCKEVSYKIRLLRNR